MMYDSLTCSALHALFVFVPSMTFKVTLRPHNISHIGQVKIDLQGDIKKNGNEPFKYFLPFKLVLKIWVQEID